MEVTLLHHTPLWVCAKAIRKCWASEDKSDTVETRPYVDYDINEYDESVYFIVEPQCGARDMELVERVANKNKHGSTLEHLVYTFDIDGISRACLQELARHRIASYSVKSTRYTLKELKTAKDEELLNFVVQPDNVEFTSNLLQQLSAVREHLRNGMSNDRVKYLLPEAFKTSLVWTINARSLQNFLSLRTASSALKEIQNLANEVFNNLPDDHKYLFEHCVHNLKPKND